MNLIPGSRAPYSIDLVSTAILLVIPILVFSIFLVRKHKKYREHKKIQVALSIAVLVVLIIFEIDIRLNGWRQYAEISPYMNNGLIPFLIFHVIIACLATIFWTWTVFHALRKSPSPAEPGPFSTKHKLLGRLAAFFMICTSITGWTFFYMAFVAV